VRSIFGKILLWTFGTLVLSLVAFVAISLLIARHTVERGDNIFRRLAAMQMAEAQYAYESGGPERLSAYLAHLRRYFPHADHILTDAAGRDLATGQDRSALATHTSVNWSTQLSGDGRMVVGMESSDHRYKFLALVRPPIGLLSFTPYYLLILLAVGGLSYLLAVNLASPLRVLATKVDQFGGGDLSVRMQPRRNDEIGDLGRAFDQMADRIQTLLAAERRLLQDISHELRSPLARLSFATELVRTAEDRDAAVARIRKEVTRLTSLVSSLLEVTRAEGDPSVRSAQPVSLDALLAEVVEDCRIEADARHCRVRLRAPDPVDARGDAELLRRAFENVLRNAIRHAPEETEIEVNLERQPTLSVISVRDRGPGVPANLLPAIFQPFFRVEAARDNVTGGVGLGLAIAHRAIYLHNGRIWAENADPGLVVRIELPSGPGFTRKPAELASDPGSPQSATLRSADTPDA
jgi:signal transduction histidine kinase